MKKEKQYVRRGFDIDISLYKKMRVAVVNSGMKTKDWLARAIRNQLKRDAKRAK